ncbi:hypothetical protein FHS27_000660 [Rhodopirellula rubra]|uniref:Uncharacterized protein n=1 Tax=Aporhodopirellula rubra TaxID=980271 RepID=A0A7W5H482_9BACT|nr:hypothetical protein [Aporhodopirellula rubra]
MVGWSDMAGSFFRYESDDQVADRKTKYTAPMMHIAAHK